MKNPTRIAPILILLLALALPALAADNIFEPFLNDNPPEIVKIMKEYQTEGVKVTKLQFLSRVVPETGDKVICFGILCRPATGSGPRPGVLVCHGGGASAERVLSYAMAWAKKGYVSFCQDEPGIGPEKVQPNTSGPWKKMKWGRFTVSDGPTHSIIFDGVASALNGLRILRSQPDVDKSKIGVTGGSWGGYMTTIVSGLAGDRVTAAFAIYGCGYYELGSAWKGSLMKLDEKTREIWLTNIDAGRRVPNMKAAYFTTPASDDWFFWPPAVMATYNAITAPKNIAWSPNDSHVITFPGGAKGPQNFDRRGHRVYMEIPWMEYHLEGKGKPFPVCTSMPQTARQGDDFVVTCRVQSELPIKHAYVFHSYGEIPWRMRWWKRVDARETKPGVYTAHIPVYETNLPVNWFGYIVEERDITITSIMNEAKPADARFADADRRNHTFSEDFEGKPASDRWVIPYSARRSYAKRKANFKITTEAAHSGKKGLLLTNDIVASGNGFRALAAQRAGTTGVAFWARSPGGTGLRVLVRGEDESGRRHDYQVRVDNPGAEWKRIEVKWSDFQFVGKGEAPFKMFSPNVGQLCFRAAPNATVHIDDIELTPTQ